MSKYNKLFYSLSFFYLSYFFIFPLFLSLKYEGVEFASYYFLIDDYSRRLVLMATPFFIFGFVSYDFFKSIFLKKEKVVSFSFRYNENKIGIIVNFLLCVYFSYILLNLLDSGRAEYIYSVRSGEADSNLLDFFFSQLMSAFKFVCLVLLLILNRKKMASVLIMITLISLLLTGGGRFNILLHFLVLLVVLFKLNDFKLSIILYISFPFFIPFMFVLKAIVFSISSGNFFDYLDNIDFGFAFQSYITNFGHPFISMLEVDRTIEIVGYRYFYDFIQGFLFYFKLIGFDFGDSITYFNTESLINRRESIIPPGYLAMGYVQLGFLGVYFSGWLYRMIGLIGENIIRLSEVDNNSMNFFVAFVMANSFYHGDVRIMVMSIFFPVLLLLLILRFSRLGER
ncbi:hypothetical protein NQ041_14475 [Vibrio diabolicus]|uniref:hypothetical protein n=1 Tax=Vibrio diabolicus TaxID=50719 RepID=UPI00211B77F8|nr:hypothetical protein [Vibrio diabolicus]MCQ9246393.1 hypothetical protein [Vibrio diabolicus]